jgi:endonuclease YncB( thermonuclease family)
MTLIRVAILVALQLGRIGGRIEAPHPSHRALRKPASLAPSFNHTKIAGVHRDAQVSNPRGRNGDTIFLTYERSVASLYHGDTT